MQNPQLDGNSFYWAAGPIGILLIHGFTATTAEVRPLAKTLLSNNYTVSAPLLPGHGTNPSDANRFTWRDWTNAVQSAYTALTQTCEVVFIGGESLGGLLALYQAAHSPSAAGIMLYAPAIILRSALVPLIAPWLSLVAPIRNKPRTDPTVADTFWQGYTVYPLRAMKQLLRLQKVVIKLLPSIEQPLLLVQGDMDRSVRSDGPEIICQNIGSEIKSVHRMSQSGHCVLLDCERVEVEALTLKFLTDQTILGKMISS